MPTIDLFQKIANYSLQLIQLVVKTYQVQNTAKLIRRMIPMLVATPGPVDLAEEIQLDWVERVVHTDYPPVTMSIKFVFKSNVPEGKIQN